jgi:hypothetical protein
VVPNSNTKWLDQNTQHIIQQQFNQLIGRIPGQGIGLATNCSRVSFMFIKKLKQQHGHHMINNHYQHSQSNMTVKQELETSYGLYNTGHTISSSCSSKQ